MTDEKSLFLVSIRLYSAPPLYLGLVFIRLLIRGHNFGQHFACSKNWLEKVISQRARDCSCFFISCIKLLNTKVLNVTLWHPEAYYSFNPFVAEVKHLPGFNNLVVDSPAQCFFCSGSFQASPNTCWCD